MTGYYAVIKSLPGVENTVLSANWDEAFLEALQACPENLLDEWLERGGCVRHSVRQEQGTLHFIHPNDLRDDCTGFFSRVLDTSHDEIYVCDGEGQTLYCNKSLERNYGISREQMLTMTAMDLVAQGYSDKTPITEVMETGHQATMEQLTSVGRTMLITATPYPSPDGTTEFIVENCRDITELEELRGRLKRKEQEAARYRAEVESIRRLEHELNVGRFDHSPAMRQVTETAIRVGRTDATLLILGESGTGKSHIARYIHQNSPRAEGPFVSINCSALASSLFESELFGYVAGAFTGAESRGKVGQLELADRGTLFLDEIGDVPLGLQSKLLEVIQEKHFTPVGGVKQKKVDVRIIAATNRDLKSMVTRKEFREDLYYRLKVVELRMPALRDRHEDIDGLLDFYVSHYSREYDLPRTLSAETRRMLNRYPWPGNIRELQNLMHSLIINSGNEQLQPSDLPDEIQLACETPIDTQGTLSLGELLENYEKTIVERCFPASGSSYKLARMLDISQSKASRLIRRYINP